MTSLFLPDASCSAGKDDDFEIWGTIGDYTNRRNWLFGGYLAPPR
jgi:hypothetical protein